MKKTVLLMVIGIMALTSCSFNVSGVGIITASDNIVEKDNVFFGKIEGINGLVNFEGESVKELTDAFHEAVDDYLAYCEDEGIEPDKSYSGVLNVRLTPAIHRQIAILARQAGLTLNAYIKDALEEKVEEAVAV